MAGDIDFTFQAWVSTETWYVIHVWHDSVNDETRLSVKAIKSKKKLKRTNKRVKPNGSF
jgi:hypothetical protein